MVEQYIERCVLGGNCCKTTRRFEKDEYFELADEMSLFLTNHGIYHDVIQAYRTKESFGDMDILIRNDKLEEKYNSIREYVAEVIKNELNSKEWVPNGDVISFNYKDIQVDFIFQNPEWYECAKNYFSFNDLGNLAGRCSHRMGFKFGHDGTWYVLRDGDYVIKEILVSRDYHFMLDYFGFDSERYKLGFNELEDIFQFIINSKYFCPSIFLLENRNHTARVRDRKRKTYTEFLKRIEGLPDTFEFKSKDFYLQEMLADERFKDFKAEYDAALAYHAVYKSAKEKYNGEMVSRVTGLTHKELGEFMADFKNTHTAKDKNSFWYYIDLHTAEEIETIVAQHYEAFRQ